MPEKTRNIDVENLTLKLHTYSTYCICIKEKQKASLLDVIQNYEAGKSFDVVLVGVAKSSFKLLTLIMTDTYTRELLS
jgi:hypothetical protein